MYDKLRKVLRVECGQLLPALVSQRREVRVDREKCHGALQLLSHQPHCHEGQSRKGGGREGVREKNYLILSLNIIMCHYYRQGGKKPNFAMFKSLNLLSLAPI